MDNLDAWMKRALDSVGQKIKGSKEDQKPAVSSKPAPQKKFNKPQPKPARKPQHGPRSEQSSRPNHHHHRGGPRPAPLRSNQAPKTASSNKKAAAMLPGTLKIIPLGGLNEVGKNMMALEYEEDIIIIDMGFEFPGEDMLGIDYVIPDVTYLEENKKRIKGVILTHAHLDHIGGVPYILPKLDFPPLYGARFTMGMVQKRIQEFKQEKYAQLRIINPDEPLKLGKFLCTFFRVIHSIPDALGVVIDTPVGKIVHTGDFKFDEQPAGLQEKADIHKMEALGRENVLALFSDSTNALKPGHTMSEAEVGDVLEEVVKATEGRLIVASFASQVGRMQQILDLAEKYNRKVFISGRSMLETLRIASNHRYLKFPPNLVHDIKKYKNIPDNQALILTTGSQGEAVSALSRIARDDHPHVKVKPGDTILLSSSPIVGNERAIFSVVNNLCLKGAKVIHSQIMEVHTSGHGKQDELKRMINMVKPKYFIPVHGEYFMRQGHGELAIKECGIPAENVIMLQNGDVLMAEKDRVYKSDETVETKYILIDGLGEGHVGSQVQVDREVMSQNGALIILVYVSLRGKKIIKKPEIVSRGFIYMHESEEITREISEMAEQAYRNLMAKHPNVSRKEAKSYIKQTVDKYTHSKLERRPLIIPLIIEC